MRRNAQRTLLPALARAAAVFAVTFIGAVMTTDLCRVIKFFLQRVLFQKPRIGTMRAFILPLRPIPPNFDS
jgi:hypothetical protein